MKNNATTAEREAPVQPKQDPKMADLMKQAEAAGSLGAPHKTLEPLVGEWDAEVSCWMHPDGPPTASRGSAKANWILNGHFLQEEFHGEFMGKPFSGISLTGYDNFNNKY